MSSVTRSGKTYQPEVKKPPTVDDLLASIPRETVVRMNAKFQTPVTVRRTLVVKENLEQFRDVLRQSTSKALVDITSAPEGKPVSLFGQLETVHFNKVMYIVCRENNGKIYLSRRPNDE